VFGTLVEVFEEVFDFVQHGLDVGYLDVGTVFTIDAVEVVAEDYTLNAEDLLFGAAELFCFF